MSQNTPSDRNAELNKHHPSANGGFKTFDHNPEGVSEYLQRYGINIKGDKRSDDGTWVFLDRCPVVPGCASDNPTDIGVFVGDTGTIGDKNPHDRGEGKKWLDVRNALEPATKCEPKNSGIKTT